MKKKSLLCMIPLMALSVLSIPCRAGNVPAEPVGAVVLDQALKLAGESNPELLSAQHELTAADCRKVQAGVRPNPNLSFEAENVFGKNELKGFDSAEYTAQLEQTLEIGGKRSKRVRAAELNRQLSAFDLQARKLDIKAETVRRFTAVQGAQEQLALGREFMTLADDFVKAVSARVLAGKVSPMEEEKARILQAQQKTILFQAERALESARVQLSAMWGNTNPRFDHVTGDFFVVPRLESMPELVAGLKENPDVGRWVIEIEQRKAVLKTERAARIPDLSIAGGVRRFSDTGEEAFVMGVSVPLPLFDRNQGTVREAATLISMAEQQRASAEVTANASLVEAYQAFLAASNKVSTLEADIIPRGKTVHDSVRNGYLQGKFSYLEVLDAQRGFCEARSEYIEAMVMCHKAAADIERIAGIQKLIK